MNKITFDGMSILKWLNTNGIDYKLIDRMVMFSLNGHKVSIERTSTNTRNFYFIISKDGNKLYETYEKNQRDLISLINLVCK